MNKPNPPGIREIFGPGLPPAELKPEEKNLPAVLRKPDPVDSGFDDSPACKWAKPGEKIYIPVESLKPWPLCFTIFGLGLLLAIAWALLFSGCAQTTITSKFVTLKTQANIRNFTASETGFHFDEMNHSTPTLAGGKAIGGATTAIGTAAAGFGTVFLAR